MVQDKTTPRERRLLRRTLENITLVTNSPQIPEGQIVVGEIVEIYNPEEVCRETNNKLLKIYGSSKESSH